MPSEDDDGEEEEVNPTGCDGQARLLCQHEETRTALRVPVTAALACFHPGSYHASRENVPISPSHTLASCLEERSNEESPSSRIPLQTPSVDRLFAPARLGVPFTFLHASHHA